MSQENVRYSYPHLITFLLHYILNSISLMPYVMTYLGWNFNIVMYIDIFQ